MAPKVKVHCPVDVLVQQIKDITAGLEKEHDYSFDQLNHFFEIVFHTKLVDLQGETSLGSHKRRLFHALHPDKYKNQDTRHVSVFVVPILEAVVKYLDIVEVSSDEDGSSSSDSSSDSSSSDSSSSDSSSSDEEETTKEAEQDAAARRAKEEQKRRAELYRKTKAKEEAQRQAEVDTAARRAKEEAEQRKDSEKRDTEVSDLKAENHRLKVDVESLVTEIGVLKAKIIDLKEMQDKLINLEKVAEKFKANAVDMANLKTRCKELKEENIRLDTDLREVMRKSEEELKVGFGESLERGVNKKRKRYENEINGRSALLETYPLTVLKTFNTIDPELCSDIPVNRLESGGLQVKFGCPEKYELLVILLAKWLLHVAQKVYNGDVDAVSVDMLFQAVEPKSKRRGIYLEIEKGRKIFLRKHRVMQYGAYVRLYHTDMKLIKGLALGNATKQYKDWIRKDTPGLSEKEVDAKLEIDMKKLLLGYLPSPGS